MIDDIVQMILVEARTRNGKDLVYEISEVMRIIDICVNHAVSIYLQEHKDVVRPVKPSHDWRCRN